MMESDLHPADDYSHRFFIWHEWIQANGPLTAQNALDYFATSMFWDKQSTNQVLRMQTMHTGQPLENEAEELKRFTGVEFALVKAEAPSLFIIHKRERFSEIEVRPISAYFIMNNRIYQSPDVYNIISNRLLTAMHSLQSSLDTLRAHRPAYTPRTGFVWPIVDPPVPAASAHDDDARRREGTAEPAGPAAPQKATTNALLLNAMRTTAAHSSASFAPPAAEPDPASVAPSASRGTPAAGVSAAPTPAPLSAGVGSQKRAAADAMEVDVSAASAGPGAPGAKGIPGAGKKKRKRTGMALPQPQPGVS